jgi:myo-inositol-1(or 4)-monophosphatase
VTEELLEVALEAAHCAGDVLLERMATRRAVTAKGYRDTVTDADIAAESAVIALLRARFPDHAILSEEAGEMDAPGSTTWVVDPLDGTTNYSHGHPTFCVSIAALQSGRPAVGVVHDPVRGHTFAACEGKGATLNGAPVRASRLLRLSEAMIALDWAHADADRERVLQRLVVLAPRCRSVRALGSAALALAYVGAGWVDAYFAVALKPWDTAAAGLIVAEAGGKLTELDGEPWRVGEPALLATNGHLHEELLAAWSEARL